MKMKHNNLEDVVVSTNDALNLEQTSKQENSELISEQPKVSETDTQNASKSNFVDEPITKIEAKVNDEILKNNSNISFEVKLVEANLNEEQIEKITIHPFLNTIPKLSDEEFKALETDILEIGMIESIILTKKLECIGGRAKLEVFLKHPKKVQPHFKFYDDNENTIRDYIIRTNIIRRHLSKGQRAALAVKVYEEVKLNREKNKSLLFMGIKVNVGEKSRTAVAKYFAISETLLSNAYTIYNNAPELIESILIGAIAFNIAYKLATENDSDNSDNVDENEVDSKDINDASLDARQKDNAKLTIGEPMRKSEDNKSKGTEENTDVKLSLTEKYERDYRALRPLEIALIKFLKDDLSIPKAEDLIIKLLTKEDVMKAEINSKRTDDEKFDILCQIFLEFIVTTDISDIEQLKYSSKFELVKSERHFNEKMTFDEQVESLKTMLGQTEKSLLELSLQQINKRTQNELNIEVTILGKVFFFVRKCDQLIAQDEQLQGVQS
jgi:hypothetical protein